MVQELPLRVEAHQLAPGAEARVDRENGFLPERRCQQQLSEVGGKDADGFGVRLLLRLEPGLALDGRAEEPLVAVVRGQAHLLAARRAGRLEEQALEDGNRPLVSRRDADTEEPFGLAAADREHAVAGDAGDRLGPVEVVPELRALGFLAGHDRGPVSYTHL